VHEQFRSGDVAAVLGCQKHHSRCDLCEEAIEIAEVRDVTLDALDTSAAVLDRRRELGIAALSDEDVRLLLYKLLRGRKADAAICHPDEGDCPVKLRHGRFALGPSLLYSFDCVA